MGVYALTGVRGVAILHGLLALLRDTNTKKIKEARGKQKPYQSSEFPDATLVATALARAALALEGLKLSGHRGDQSLQSIVIGLRHSISARWSCSSAYVSGFTTNRACAV